MIDDKKLPPFNEEAERSVVGAALIDPDAIPRVASIISPGDFYKPELRAIWKAMLALHERNEPVDLLTVSDEMGTDEPSLLTKLINEVPTSVHAEHYAKMTARDATRRRFLDASGKIAKAAFDDSMPLPDMTDLAIKLIIDARPNSQTQAQSLSHMARAYYDHIEKMARSDGVLGLPTGFHDLDEIVGGLQRSDLVLLAARPAMGKSSLAACILRNVAKAGGRIMFFSLEMSNDQIMRRLIALESSISITSLKTGKLAESEWPPFMQATDQMDSLPVIVDDTPGITPSHVRAVSLKAEATLGPLDLIIVDYLQLMKPDKGKSSRYEAVTEIGQALKGIAKDLNVPVLALSQLNRACESRGDKRPLLHDLRESGDLEQTANIVMFIYRDEVYDSNAESGLAEVAVAKSRDGPKGTAMLHFAEHLARFSDATITREVL